MYITNSVNKLGVQQYTMFAFIRGEHSNCLSEVGCLPEGRQSCKGKQFGCSPHMMATLFYYTETTYKNNVGMFK
jgi:hypothetical protein